MNMIRNLCTVCRGATLLWRTGMVLGLWCYAAVAAAATESQVKAAFILNFTAYIEWPAATKAKPHWTVVVAGHAELQQWLVQGSKNRQFAGRPVQVRAWTPEDALTDADIVFFGTDYAGESQILTQLRKRPVLTVGETAAFASQGGMIRLVKSDNRLRFDVNRQPMQQSGLKASAKLLKLAHLIDGS